MPAALTTEQLNPHNIAAIVQDNRTLRKLIRALRAKDRKPMYDAMLPYLCFKPKPFLLIK